MVCENLCLDFLGGLHEKDSIVDDLYLGDNVGRSGYTPISIDQEDGAE